MRFDGSTTLEVYPIDLYKLEWMRLNGSTVLEGGGAILKVSSILIYTENHYRERN